MADRVPAEDIERIVGAQRAASRHLARAVSAEQTVYIVIEESQLLPIKWRPLRG